MDPFTMMALSGLFGNVFGGLMGSSAQDKANQTNIGLQEDQQAFLEMMAGSAHQREVADLEKAGLNPILSAGGGGAATPTPALAHVEPVNPAQGLSGGITAAMQAVSAVSQADLNDANAALADASRATEVTKQAVNLSNVQNLDADTKKKLEEALGLNVKNFYAPIREHAEAATAVSAKKRSIQQEAPEQSEAKQRGASADWRAQHPVLDDAIDKVMQMLGVWTKAKR